VPSKAEGVENPGAATSGEASGDGQGRSERCAGIRHCGRGIAIGAGTNVAVEAGDIVLVRSDLRDVPRIVSLASELAKDDAETLVAVGYNIIAIPLAEGVFASRGFVLSPAIGAVLMSASTVILAINAQLLRRVRLLTVRRIDDPR
jgi:hypothetical protein